MNVNDQVGQESLSCAKICMLPFELLSETARAIAWTSAPYFVFSKTAIPESLWQHATQS